MSEHEHCVICQTCIGPDYGGLCLDHMYDEQLAAFKAKKREAAEVPDGPAAAEAPKANRRHSGFGHESPVNESVEWYTPPEIFEALDITFDLDPCSPGEGKSYVPAKKHYTAADDGLASPWHGTVFVNPPYGPHTKAWMKKLAEHGDGIALVFARTDVKWFQEHGIKADLVCFIAGRIKFFQGDITKRGGSPGAGSMLLAFGEKATAAVLNSGLGPCFRLATPEHDAA